MYFLYCCYHYWWIKIYIIAQQICVGWVPQASESAYRERPPVYWCVDACSYYNSISTALQIGSSLLHDTYSVWYSMRFWSAADSHDATQTLSRTVNSFSRSSVRINNSINVFEPSRLLNCCKPRLIPSSTYKSSTQKQNTLYILYTCTFFFLSMHQEP